MGRGERPIKLGDSSVIPEMHLGAASECKCYRGRATDWTRGLHRLPNPDEPECYNTCPGVRRGVLRSRAERETTQIIS